MYLNYRDLDADIIIIGANITGLSAAYYLLEKDPHLDLLILDVNESNNTSARSESSLWNLKWIKKESNWTMSSIDLSLIDNQYISPKQKNVFELLDKLDISVRKHKISGHILVDYNEIYEVQGREKIFSFLSPYEETVLNSFCYEVYNLSQKVTLEDPKKNKDMLKYDKMTMDVFLNKFISKSKVKNVIAQTFLLNTGLQATDVSALFFLAYCNSTEGIENQFHKQNNGIHHFSIEGGVNFIKSKIINEIGRDSIIYVPEVSEISWDDYCIGIKTPNKYLFAKTVIYTLSETEIIDITFTPPLPEQKINMANNFVKGTLKKFALIYEKPFWDEKHASGDVYVMNTESKNGPIQICVNISKIEEKLFILMGLANQECHKGDILQQLNFYFGKNALNPEIYLENMSSFLELGFPYGCVTMSFFDYIQLDSNRIIWASPETAKAWYGTIAGSIGVGSSGAIRALLETKPNILSYYDLQAVRPDDVVILPRSLGIFGIKWHIIVPTVLFSLILILVLKKRFSKK